MNERREHFHGGPLAGQEIEHDALPRHALEDGRIELHWRGQDGEYFRDQLSDGGRCWDWRAA